jgi:hypothetical protein
MRERRDGDKYCAPITLCASRTHCGSLLYGGPACRSRLGRQPSATVISELHAPSLGSRKTADFSGLCGVLEARLRVKTIEGDVLPNGSI